MTFFISLSSNHTLFSFFFKATEPSSGSSLLDIEKTAQENYVGHNGSTKTEASRLDIHSPLKLTGNPSSK
jgi:hypothetical protein